MQFERVYSGAPWEDKVGYCRVLKAGSAVFVTGTAAVGEGGEVHAPGDIYEQTKHCLEIIRRSLAELGVTMERVTRTRIFVTDIDQWEEVGRAHSETFGGHRPTTTMVEVSRLVDPKMLVEIEADAVAE